MHQSHGTFRPSGTITLTTDFGLDDPYVGVMKGIVARTVRGLNVIDLCHGVPPFRPEIAGLWIGRCFRWFANGSVHVAVVDPGVGTERSIVCIETPGHCFLTPDNGLAGELTRHLDKWSATSVDCDTLGLEVISPTFHGRDIFAPVAARLAAGEVRPADLGPTVPTLVPSPLPLPRHCADRIEGEVLLPDRFGNVSTNIPGPPPAGWTDARLAVGTCSLRLVRTYDEAGAGEYVAIFNSFGLLEISMPRGSAAGAELFPPGTPACLHESR